MTKISLNYEDRQFFHPSPTPRMRETINALLEKFGWKIDIPIDKLTREEAKELIGKGIRASKRKKTRIFETKEDEINKELALIN